VPLVGVTRFIMVSSDFEHRLVGPYSAACNNGTGSKSDLGVIPDTQFPCVSESIHAYGVVGSDGRRVESFARQPFSSVVKPLFVITSSFT
jgi:hypothetical protein